MTSDIILTKYRETAPESFDGVTMADMIQIIQLSKMSKPIIKVHAIEREDGTVSLHFSGKCDSNNFNQIVREVLHARTDSSGYTP